MKASSNLSLAQTSAGAETDAAMEQTPISAAVAAILALPIGGRYIEENWGPYLLGETELVDGKYPTYSLRIVVERESGLSHEAYLFEPQKRTDDGRWEPTDFGMSTPLKPMPYRRWAKPKHVEQTLSLLRAMLDLEGAESMDGTAEERERYGITDEHLRSGTLSAATIAELASQDAGGGSAPTAGSIIHYQSKPILQADAENNGDYLPIARVRVIEYPGEQKDWSDIRIEIASTMDVNNWTVSCLGDYGKYSLSRPEHVREFAIRGLIALAEGDAAEREAAVKDEMEARGFTDEVIRREWLRAQTDATGLKVAA